MFKFNFNIYIYHIMGAKNSKTKKNTKNPGDRDFKL